MRICSYNRTRNARYVQYKRNVRSYIIDKHTHRHGDNQRQWQFGMSLAMLTLSYLATSTALVRNSYCKRLINYPFCAEEASLLSEIATRWHRPPQKQPGCPVKRVEGTCCASDTMVMQYFCLSSNTYLVFFIQSTGERRTTRRIIQRRIKERSKRENPVVDGVVLGPMMIGGNERIEVTRETTVAVDRIHETLQNHDRSAMRWIIRGTDEVHLETVAEMINREANETGRGNVIVAIDRIVATVAVNHRRWIPRNIKLHRRTERMRPAVVKRVLIIARRKVNVRRRRRAAVAVVVAVAAVLRTVQVPVTNRWNFCRN